MKISIFGCGWLGLPLAKALKKDGHLLKGLVRSVESLKKLETEEINSFLGDIENPEQIHPDFFDCDLLIISLPHKNIENFKKLKELIEKQSVSKVIYTSSTSVYQNNNDWVDEINGPLNPDSIILKIEEILKSGDYNFTCFRMSGLLGPNRHPGNFFQKSGRKVPQPCSLTNMIHIEDCIGIIKAIIDQQKWNEVYNGCSPDHAEKIKFYSECATLLGHKPPEMDFSQEPSFKIVDGGKVTKELGYQYQIDNFLEYFSNN